MGCICSRRDPGTWLPDVGGVVVDVQFHVLCRDPSVITVGVSGRT